MELPRAGEKTPVNAQHTDAPRPTTVVSDVDFNLPQSFIPDAQVAQAAEVIQMMQAQSAANTAAAADAAGRATAGTAGTSKQPPPGVTPETDKLGRQLEKWVGERVNLLAAPVHMMHALTNGTSSAPPSQPLDPETEAASKAPPLKPSIPEERRDYSGDLLAEGTRAIESGIRGVFGTTVERNENPNTRLSSNVIVQECNDVIKKNVRLHGFKHIAGASEDGLGENEVGEFAMKDGKMNSGGGGHSFPDILYERGGELVAINSATESAPGRYIGREVRSFARLAENMGRWVAAMTGKKRPDEDIEEYRERARQVCEEAFGKHLAEEDSESNNQVDNSGPVSP